MSLNGIRVTAFRWVPEDERFENCGSYTTGQESGTDDDGQFFLRGLYSGSYVLKYEDAGDDEVGRPPKHYKTVYTGGVSNIDEATRFELSGSTSKSISLSAGHVISGTVS